MSIVEFNGRKPKIHPTVFVASSSQVIGDVEIGSDSGIWFGVVIRGDVGKVRIGTKTNIQDNVVIHPSSKFPTFIGDSVTVGHGCIIHGCRIGCHSLIGSGAILMDGVEVGKNSIIGAGSVVPKGVKIPEGVVAVGIPAKILRSISNRDLYEITRASEIYVDLAKKYSKREV